MPADLLFYGGGITSDYGSGGTRVKVSCSEGISAINETSKSFENVSPCWKIPTAPHTTTAPTTSPNTVAPSTSLVTNEPSTSPVTNPTTQPSTSPLTTTSTTTVSTGMVDAEVRALSTSSYSFLSDSDDNLSTMYIIGSCVLAFVLFSLVAFFVRRHREKKAKDDQSNLD
eukprot:350013_1